MTFAVALDVRAELGECPIWSVEEQALFFVDIKGRALHRFDPRTGTHNAIPMPEEIGCIGFRKGGGFIAGFRSGLWLLDASGVRLEKLADNPEDQSQSRFNDGRVDPAGRFLAGTIDEPKLGGRAPSVSLRRPRSFRAGGRASHIEWRRVLAGRTHALSCRHADLHDLALCLRSRYRRRHGSHLVRASFTDGKRSRPARWCGCRCARVLLDGALRGRPDSALLPRWSASRRISGSGSLPHDGRLRRPRSQDPVCDLGAYEPSRRRTRSPAAFGQPVFHEGRGARPSRTSF